MKRENQAPLLRLTGDEVTLDGPSYDSLSQVNTAGLFTQLDNTLRNLEPLVEEYQRMQR